MLFWWKTEIVREESYFIHFLFLLACLLSCLLSCLLFSLACFRNSLFALLLFWLLLGLDLSYWFLTHRLLMGSFFQFLFNLIYTHLSFSFFDRFAFFSLFLIMNFLFALWSFVFLGNILFRNFQLGSNFLFMWLGSLCLWLWLIFNFLMINLLTFLQLSLRPGLWHDVFFFNALWVYYFFLFKIPLFKLRIKLAVCIFFW